MKPSKDFEEFFELLNENNVKYLVVGGYAFAVHAEPRFTKDLDIFIDRNPENATKLIKTIQDFGFGSVELTEDDFLNPGYVIQLGQPPYRIDIMSDISGVTFEDAWKNKVIGTYGEQEVNFIGKEELRKNKRAAGRKSDLEDLDRLE